MFRKSSHYVLLLLGLNVHIAQISSFSPSLSTTTTSTSTFTHTNMRNARKCRDNQGLFMSAEPSKDLNGKFVAQRYIYRFSPTKSPIQTPYTIEERQYYSVAEDRSLEPFGDKKFIFRGPEGKNDDVEPPEESVKKNGMPRFYTRLGPALHTVEGLQDEEDAVELGGSVWETSYVMALYCMEHPEVISGKGLEVGSGVGIGGILSVIGAGVASGSTEQSASSGHQSIEDIANTPAADDDGNGEGNMMAPVPATLTKITLTDSHENLINKCIDNLSAASFPVSKAEVDYLDWNRRVPNDKKDQFNFIIGCECAYYFPLVAPLARTVAYALKSSPYDRQSNKQSVRGTFLHFGPQHRESIDDLKRKLGKGYRMDTRMKEIVFERVDLVPLIIDSLEDAEAQMKEEVEGETGGFVEYQNINTSKHVALIGYHNEDYDGFNGDFFFPAETGKESSYGDSSQELDFGTETA